MKKLDVTPITNSAQFFPKKGTLEFLQLAFKEGFAGIVKGLIGNSYSATTVYVLYGCVNSGTYPAYNITDGVVFFNGEIYYVDATSYTATGSDVAVWGLVQTQYTTDADPCTFSDYTTHNIHNIRKLRTTAAAAGSGLFDYSTSVVLNFTVPPQINLTATGLSSISGVYPNLVINTPAPAKQDPVCVWLGRVTSNGAVINKLFGSATVPSCSHPGVGVYVVTHNIGHTNYFVRGIVIGLTPIGLKSITNITSTTFSVSFADDDTGNDCDFELDIHTYTP